MPRPAGRAKVNASPTVMHSPPLVHWKRFFMTSLPWAKIRTATANLPDFHTIRRQREVAVRHSGFPDLDTAMPPARHEAARPGKAQDFLSTR